MRSIESNVFILTGAIQTGKSTALQKVIHELREKGKIVAGLLNPVINNKKKFINLETDEHFAMEETPQDDSILVGKYVFSSEAFNRARDIIKNTPQYKCDLFVIDEIGKLEIKGQGLEPAISSALNSMKQSEIKNIILVIRDYLLEEATLHFGLEAARIITTEDLKSHLWLS